MSTGGTSHEHPGNDLTPEAARKRKRFWIKWVIVNLALTLIVVPGLFLLLGDVIVQLFEGSDTVRLQAGVGVYLAGVASAFCTFLPFNIAALACALAAKAGREGRYTANGSTTPTDDTHGDFGGPGGFGFRRGPRNW